MADEFSSRRVNQGKHQRYFQVHEALAHSNGCKKFPSRKSGRNLLLHCGGTASGEDSPTAHGMASKPKIILQKLGIQEELGFSADKGKAEETFCYPLHWTRCSCMYLS